MVNAGMVVRVMQRGANPSIDTTSTTEHEAATPGEYNSHPTVIGALLGGLGGRYRRQPVPLFGRAGRCHARAVCSAFTNSAASQRNSPASVSASTASTSVPCTHRAVSRPGGRRPGRCHNDPAGWFML